MGTPRKNPKPSELRAQNLIQCDQLKSALTIHKSMPEKGVARSFEKTVPTRKLY